MSSDPPRDSLTVLISVNGKHAGKRFSIDKKTGKIRNRSYGNEMYFSVANAEVCNLAELARALEQIARNPHSFVIRGEPLPGINLKHTLRRSVPNRKTGDPATFTEEPRHWFLADIDHIPCPVTIDPKSEPEDAVEYVLGLLPPELHDAWCYWQFSSSQSVEPKYETLSLHLWFWNEAPLDNAAVKRWAVAANQAAGYKLIDPAPFSAVQAHYIVPPVFEGLTDPLKRRSGVREGLDKAVSLVIPPSDKKRTDRPSAAGYEPGIGVQALLAQIGGPEGFRGPIRSAIASYIAIHGSQADCAPLKAAIRAALDRAEPGWRNDPNGARYDKDEHLDALIDWTRTIHGDQPPRGFVPEPPEHIVDANIPIDAAEQPPEAMPPRFSDEVLTLQFSAIHADNLRYVALWAKWLTWNDSHWRFEETLQAFDLARAHCRDVSAQITDPRAVKLAAAVASAKTVAAVERLARADRRHAMMAEQWNADSWRFNGKTTVDLGTGQCCPPRREDYITKIAAANPEHAGDCPLWHAFLRRVTDEDLHLQHYLQRVAGYCLTGTTREHVMFFLYGTGANGKSIFLNTLRAIWNDYAAIAPMETFCETRNERHPTDLAFLQGVRLVVAHETERNHRWAESKIKALTGGDPITARYMRQDFFTYVPQFKLMIAGNHKPSLRGVDEALRRRLHLIPFTVTIPEPERDPELFEKLKAEWDAILKWAVEGCLEWQSTGLAPPPAVRGATDAYLAEEDTIGRWLDECCAVDPIYSAGASELFANWKSWTEKAGEYSGSQKRFSQALIDRGFAQARGGDGRQTFRGLALKP